VSCGGSGCRTAFKSFGFERALLNAHREYNRSELSRERYGGDAFAIDHARAARALTVRSRGRIDRLWGSLTLSLQTRVAAWEWHAHAARPKYIMTHTRLQRFEVRDPVHDGARAVVLAPVHTGSALPLCLFLYGGSGSRESLADIRPLLEAWWDSGAWPPLLVATLDFGPWSFYLDDPARGLGWESLVAHADYKPVPLQSFRPLPGFESIARPHVAPLSVQALVTRFAFTE
jgi:hypothetical protein